MPAMRSPGAAALRRSVASGLLRGPSVEFYARRLVHRCRVPGRVRLRLAGRVEKLLRLRRIDERLRVPVGGDVELDVWLLRGRGPSAPRGTVLQIHGVWDSKARFLGLGERMAARGFDVAMPDLRAHGASGGPCITYGALETRDMGRLMDALYGSGRARGPLYVFGVSMGAAIAVRYAAGEGRCGGVVAVAPYRDARAVVRRFVPLMARAKYEAIWRRGAEIAGFDAQDTSTTDAASALRCPLIVVHGRMDWLVPFGHGRAVFQAAPQPKRLIAIPWAGHWTVLAGRAGWFADRVEELAELGP